MLAFLDASLSPLFEERADLGHRKNPILDYGIRRAGLDNSFQSRFSGTARNKQWRDLQHKANCGRAVVQIDQAALFADIAIGQ